jgi:hypothetical protein
VNREYDLFEKLSDGAPVRRQHVAGLLNAYEMLGAIASTTRNECFCHVPFFEGDCGAAQRKAS